MRFENGNQIVKETINDRLLVMYLPKHKQLSYNALLNIGKETINDPRNKVFQLIDKLTMFICGF